MNVDTKLKLLAGKPITVNGFGDVIPLKLSEIVDIGYENYNKYMGIILNELKNLEIYNDMDVKLRNELNFLDLCFILYEQESLLLKEFITAISIITKKSNIETNFNDRILTFDDGFYLGNNLMELQQIIKFQNCLSDINEKKEEEFKPANDKARELIEKMKKNRERLAKAKAAINKENMLDLHDVISAVTARSNSINKLNVWDLTIYQLYNEFDRLKLIDDYSFNFKAILAGAKDIQLKHWSSKL